MKYNLSVLPLLIVLSGLASCAAPPKEDLKVIRVADVDLHYTDRGKGIPLILIHGSLSDLYYWKFQDSLLAANFRVISYSRRYNFPNTNPPQHDHSVIVEAQDLLGLMDALEIKQAYIIGHSYGAYTALWFTLDHPDRVKKLVLAEPPLFKWLPSIPGGEGKSENFFEHTWIPIGEAFKANGKMAGLDTTTRRWFHTPFDSIPAELKTEMLRNVNEWQALSTSHEALPQVDKKRVKLLNIPILLLSGGLNAGTTNDLIDGELVRLLPDNHRIIITKAGHEMFVDNPGETNSALMEFLRK